MRTALIVLANLNLEHFSQAKGFIVWIPWRFVICMFHKNIRNFFYASFVPFVALHRNWKCLMPEIFRFRSCSTVSGSCGFFICSNIQLRSFVLGQIWTLATLLICSFAHCCLGAVKCFFFNWVLRATNIMFPCWLGEYTEIINEIWPAMQQSILERIFLFLERTAFKM